MGVQSGQDPRGMVYQHLHVRGAILPSAGIAQVRQGGLARVRETRLLLEVVHGDP
jgi:hypothetical protein